MRLFDKGETNIYRDDFSFALLVSKLLQQLLTETFSAGQNTEHSKFVQQKKHELEKLAVSLTKNAPKEETKNIFLQSESEQLARLSLALKTLNSAKMLNS